MSDYRIALSSLFALDDAQKPFVPLCDRLAASRALLRWAVAEGFLVADAPEQQILQPSIEIVAARMSVTDAEDRPDDAIPTGPQAEPEAAARDLNEAAAASSDGQGPEDAAGEIPPPEEAAPSAPPAEAPARAAAPEPPPSWWRPLNARLDEIGNPPPFTREADLALTDALFRGNGIEDIAHDMVIRAIDIRARWRDLRSAATDDDGRPMTLDEQQRLLKVLRARAEVRPAEAAE